MRPQVTVEPGPLRALLRHCVSVEYNDLDALANDNVETVVFLVLRLFAGAGDHKHVTPTSQQSMID